MHLESTYQGQKDPTMEPEVLDFFCTVKKCVCFMPQVRDQFVELCRKKYKELGPGVVLMQYRNLKEEMSKPNMHFPGKYYGKKDSLELWDGEDQSKRELRKLLDSYNPQNEIILVVDIRDPDRTNIDKLTIVQ